MSQRHLQDVPSPAALSAGVVDTGLASLSTFIVGLYAATSLSPSELGAYSLAFLAVFVVGLIPQQLYLLPARVAALELAAGERMMSLMHALRRGGRFSGVGSLLAAVAPLPALGEVSGEAVLALATSGAAAAYLSPLQDHLRQSLHLDRRPVTAVAMSAVQLSAVVTSLVALNLAHVPPVFAPFSALFVANAASLSVGIALTMRSKNRGETVAKQPPLKTSIPLLVAETLPAASAYGSLIIVRLVESVEALGYLEAARMVAQPVLILAVGLLQTLGPRLMEAGRDGAMTTAWKLLRVFFLLYGGLAVCYLAVAGVPHRLNPFLYLVPLAFVIPGLAVARILGFAAQAIGNLPNHILYGARRNKVVLNVRGAGAIASLLSVAALAPWLGVFSIPVSGAVAAATALTVAWIAIQR